MAYPKITVNTGVALEIIASDTLPIPAPSLPVLSGTASATSTNKLVSIFGNFNDASVGDIVYNTADKTSASVVAVESTTTLELSADIFTSGKTYTIFLGGQNGSSRIDSSEGCLLYVGSNDPGMNFNESIQDVKVKTVAGSIVTFTNFPIGHYLPVQVLQLYSTGTDTPVQNNCIAIW